MHPEALRGSDGGWSANPVTASVIIATRNRADSLERALEALSSLEVPPGIQAEIVVVDNGSTDGTGKIVSSYSRLAAVPLRYVYEARPGASAARNRGIREATGELLLFTDDDCVPGPGWLADAARAIGSNLLQVIGGRVELYDPADLPVTIKTDLAPETLTSVGALYGFLHGCNMIVGRPVFDRIGVFDTRLGPGTAVAAAEDTDLVYRAFRSSIPVSYNPAPLVFHHHGRSRQAEVDKLERGYALGKGALAAKHLLAADIGPAKLLWWQFRSAVRNWRSGRSSLSRVIDERYPLIGGLKFLWGLRR